MTKDNDSRPPTVLPPDFVEYDTPPMRCLFAFEIMKVVTGSPYKNCTNTRR